MYKPFLAALVLIALPFSGVQARTPNDIFFGDQWYLPRIGAPAAWGISTGDTDLIIAVLDTGVDLDHPDLAGNLWTNDGEIAGNNRDDDGNGFIDDVQGWDFVNDDASPEPEVAATPDSGAISHGTLIAGLIGAQSDNEIGYAGLLWEVDIMPIRVLNENGVGSEETTAEAIDYAVANGARVINMSFAGTSSGSRLRTSVRRAYDAGVVIVAALGNDAVDLDVTPVYPACFHSEFDDWVLGVGATGLVDDETEFTNYGATCADLSAPGVDILGLDHQYIEDAGDEAYGGPWNGTSISSPLVAGAAGLLLSEHPTLTPAQVFTILKLSVDPIKDTISGIGSIGVGRLNIGQALELAPSFVSDTSTAPTKPVVTTPTVATPTADEHYADSAYYSFIALGAPAGSLPTVQVYRADGAPYATFTAYTTNFSGGVRVIAEDIDGDAIPEIITGAGPGGGPHVRIFKPYGAVVSEFFAYDHASDQGVNIAVGDVDGDTLQDVVTAVGSGVSNDVVVWSQTGVEMSRFTVTGFADKAPLAVAIADVDSDWEKEIVVFSETGESRVAVYNIDGTRVVDFIAFPGETHGVRVDVGDLDEDYRDEIITVGGVGATAQVRVYNKIGAYWGGFSLPQTDATAQLRVSVADIDVNGEPDIVVAPQATAGQVSVHSLMGDLLQYVGTNIVGTKGGYLAAW
jgi:subtilisin family serine protease